MEFNNTVQRLIARNSIRLPQGMGFIRDLVRSLQKGDVCWDPWILKDDDVYRLFYLVGPRNLLVGSKKKAFWMEGKIYGAISTDLKQWQQLGIILEPEPTNVWESGRMLAGTTYKENGVYYLFYPAAGKGEIAILHEEIGLATSVDGLHWQRRYSPHQLFSNLDERDHWYGEFRTDILYWRDPYVVKDRKNGKYYMFICAHLKEVEVDEFGGCMGLAVADTISGPYKLLPPIVAPVGEQKKEWPYPHMERPQVIYKDGKYHLFFSCWAFMLNPKWVQKLDQKNQKRLTNSSLYWYVSDNITGPFNPVNDLPIVSGSETIGQYGINFLPAPDNPEELIPYGWYPKLFRIEVSPSLCRARWNDNSIKIG